MAVGGALLLAADYRRAGEEIQDGIRRNPHGQGSSRETVDVVAGDSGERIPVEIEVGEQKYTDSEVRDMFDRVIRRLDALILNGNQSLDHVEQDLDLVTVVPDEPVDLSWELSRYDVMNLQGEIERSRIEEEGTPVTVSAVLTYREDATEQARYQRTVVLYPGGWEGAKENTQEIQKELEEAEGEKPEEEIFRLPETLAGQEVSYYRHMDIRGAALLGMAVLAGILLVAREKQQKAQIETARSRQMIRDYPEIVGKLTLYLGAGMTVKRAFRKVVEEYERQKEKTGVRYAYEEMQKTCREMESGHTEAESYENFGRRCQVQAYLRLGSLLSQNLRKGTRGLTGLLKMESIQAFEERKARARRLGEEAGTKLLLPMFLMLAMVLVIVILPAFLSMQGL